MTTITIPKKVIKNDDLVIIPRKRYEALLRIYRKKSYTQLDRELDEAIKEIRQGKIVGPFRSVKEFKASFEK